MDVRLLGSFRSLLCGSVGKWGVQLSCLFLLYANVAACVRVYVCVIVCWHFSEKWHSGAPWKWTGVESLSFLCVYVRLYGVCVRVTKIIFLRNEKSIH